MKNLYEEQKRQDWDHKAYHDAPSAIYIVQLPNEEGGHPYIHSTTVLCDILSAVTAMGMTTSSKPLIIPCTGINNLEREYRDCSRRDKIGITRHIMMHQVLYNVHILVWPTL